MTQEELSVAVALLEKRFPGSVEAVELMLQYVGWRNTGVSHKEALTRLTDIANKVNMTGIERRSAEA